MTDGAPAAAVAPPLASARLRSATLVLGAAILVLALVLRIAAARGELWLDELWSLQLIDEATARHDTFWVLSSDNNHYLNTLYLWIVGADAPTLVQRGLSILLGIATVAVAGLLMRRSRNATALAAMLLFAISYPMVNYGSEARGYAGLILATLAAIHFVERAVDGAARARMKLGLVNLAGVLFQPIMLGAIVSLMAWTAWVSRTDGRPSFRGAAAGALAAARTFSWTVRLLVPVVAIVAGAVLTEGGYRIMGSVPFSAAGFAAGYGGLLRLLLGLPDAIPDALALLAVPVVLGLTLAMHGARVDRRLSLALIFLIGLPLAMFVARLPNIHFPRYYLASGSVFLLLLAELFGAAWHRGGALRAVALVALIAIGVGSAFDDARLLADGRDQTAAVMRMIAADGPASVTGDQDVRHGPIVGYFARRLQLPVTYVDSTAICAQNPQWLVSNASRDEMPDALDTASVVGCHRIFRRVAYFPQWGLSGLAWNLYRRATP